MGLEMRTLSDYRGTLIRLTDERRAHILEHPEMSGMDGEMEHALKEPEVVVESLSDPSAHLYYRYCPMTRIGGKHLCVVVKAGSGDAFILTAYLTDRVKKGKRLWPKES